MNYPDNGRGELGSRDTFSAPLKTILAIETVKPARVFGQNLLREWLRDVFALLQTFDEFFLRRGIVVAVVGADHDVIFADTFRQIGNVFIGFAGDK